MTASTTRTLRTVCMAEAMVDKLTAPRPGLRAARVRIARAHGAFSDAAR